MENYVSIIVPYFNRIHYLRELIDSAHKCADMPFELIVHDDASVDGTTPEVFQIRDRVSSLIINNGHNIGISSSVNRLVNIASSEYIIFLNSDCAFINPCFKNIVDLLSKPYIGIVHIVNVIDPFEPNITNTRFSLTGLGSGSAMAFRKHVWREVGGWPDVHSGSSDAAFVHSIFAKGYFVATPYGKTYAANLSHERAQNKDSSMGMSGYDCSHPKIFGINNYDRECKIREEECNRYANSLTNVQGSITNINYWHDHMNKLLSTGTGNCSVDKINWETARLYGHDKWKDDILKDRNVIH